MLVGVRVAAGSIGSQDFQLIEQPNRQAQDATITVRLKPTSRLSGRVRTRAGTPVAGQKVEVWFKGGTWLEPNPVGFPNGPPCTAADGSFQTPDTLLVGSSYRVVAFAPRMEPILSDWITIGEKPRVLLPMLQRPLRSISGRVVDRQGEPVEGIEVFQSGDGPERTSTRTDAGGRFTLDGFCQGPVCLFARGEGFRFFGRLVKPGDHDVTVELTRTTERPARAMRMLADPIPFEESRALARRLLEPYWKAFDEKNNDAAKYPDLRTLVMVDPIGVLAEAGRDRVYRPADEGGDADSGGLGAGPERSGAKPRLWPTPSRSRRPAPGRWSRCSMHCRIETGSTSWPCWIVRQSRPRPRLPRRCA